MSVGDSAIIPFDKAILGVLVLIAKALRPCAANISVSFRKGIMVPYFALSFVGENLDFEKEISCFIIIYYVRTFQHAHT